MGLRVENEHIIAKLSPIESNLGRLVKSAIQSILKNGKSLM